MLTGALFAVVMAREESLGRAFSASPQEFTGWFLLGLIVVLALLNARKKLTRLPLLRVYSWTTVHIYLGLFSGLLFFLHMGTLWPSALVNQVLLVLFLVLFLSGLVGLLLSRTVPRRLRLRGEELIYERIPAHRHRLARELDAIIDLELKESENLALAEFAIETLVPFFAKPWNRIGHLFRSHYREHLLFRLNTVSRFLNPKEQLLKDRLADLIVAKDDLDFTEAHQMLLKYWLFIHIPLTYALLIFLPIHVAWGLILR